MSETNEMLKILKRELEEAKESFLGDICDKCRHPYIDSEDQLAEHCDECSFYWDLEELTKKAQTVATGEVMKIVAEEMQRKETS